MGVRGRGETAFGEHALAWVGADLWRGIAEPGAHLEVFTGFRFGGSDAVSAALQYRNKDLRRNGRKQCYSGRDKGASCAGQRLQADISGTLVRGPMRLRADLRYRLVDARATARRPHFDTRHQRDIAVSARSELTTRRWRNSLSLRYLVEDTANDQNGVREIQGSVRTSVSLAGRIFALRYVVRKQLDQRAATLERVPNPEHALSFETRVLF